MTTDPGNTPTEPENGSESLPEQLNQPVAKPRFDPFTNEGDMFKIVLGVGGGVLVVALIAFLANLIF
jgi:hypothetical protein